MNLLHAFCSAFLTFGITLHSSMDRVLFTIGIILAAVIIFLPTYKASKSQNQLKTLGVAFQSVIVAFIVCASGIALGAGFEGETLTRGIARDLLAILIQFAGFSLMICYFWNEGLGKGKRHRRKSNRFA